MSHRDACGCVFLQRMARWTTMESKGLVMPQSKTIPEQGERQEKVPRMPHERDESSDSQEKGEAVDRGIGEVARKDVERGLVDTDKGPVLDDTYDRLRGSSPNPGDKPRR